MTEKKKLDMRASRNKLMVNLVSHGTRIPFRLSPEELFSPEISFCLWTQSHKIICYCLLSLFFFCCSFFRNQVLSPLSLYPYLFDSGNILVDFPVADFTVGSVLSLFMFRRYFPFKGKEIVQRRSSSTSLSSFFVLH